MNFILHMPQYEMLPGFRFEYEKLARELLA